MTDRVLIVLAGVGTVELTREAYEAALRPIAALPAERKPTPAAASDLVTAKALAQRLSLPVSCLYEYAKAGRIPCVRVGKHVRFDPARVRAALGSTGGITVGRA